ncbi:hypothetical protein CEXT_660961 [Caerostris extrusa]|uniref:Uncharacterized protein n=1 Tax=Caerostris extrusa TaxID=172846 RepID=A0AAV4SWI7_CAEEX|nr:hypothetical protein CEXT_660961 [Caerostris extrusa]
MPDHIRQHKISGKIKYTILDIPKQGKPFAPGAPVPIRNPVLQDFSISCFIPSYKSDIPFLLSHGNLREAFRLRKIGPDKIQQEYFRLTGVLD